MINDKFTLYRPLILTKIEGDTMTQTTLDSTTIKFDEFIKEAGDRIKSGQPLMGETGILTPLIKKIIDASLEGEMAHHMASCQEQGQSNRRNGKTPKTVKTAYGQVSIETPRDRDGSFEPVLIKKRQTILNQTLDNKVLALFGLGMSYQDIRNHMQEMYGTEISSAMLSKITDQLLPVITEWRN